MITARTLVVLSVADLQVTDRLKSEQVQYQERQTATTGLLMGGSVASTLGLTGMMAASELTHASTGQLFALVALAPGVVPVSVVPVPGPLLVGLIGLSVGFGPLPLVLGLVVATVQVVALAIRLQLAPEGVREENTGVDILPFLITPLLMPRIRLH